MAIIKLKKQGMSDNYNISLAMRALVQQDARRRAAAVAALTNSSGGTAGTVTYIAADAVNVANSGTSLAQKTASEAALNLVKDALLEISTQANLIATAVGIDTLTYSGGGTAADGTIGAITVAVTAATTGILATNTNTMLAALNKATFVLASFVNKLAVATGNAPVPLSTTFGAQQYTYPQTIAAITIDGGTAADPGVTKAALDAKLAIMQVNIKTIADKLVAIRATTTPLVVAV